MHAPPQKIRRALVSVSDKSGIAEFAAALAGRGIALLSTGGSAGALAAAGIPVTEVAAVTGMAEFLDGRVKTLHPAIHGGYRRAATGPITSPPWPCAGSNRSISWSAISTRLPRPSPLAPVATTASKTSISAGSR